MSLSLIEQHNIIERALSERMLNHAFIFLRQWAKELGDTPFNDRIRSLENNYVSLFDYYLSGDDTDREEVRDKMTTEVYRLSDEMFSTMRVKRGEIPEVKGYDRDNLESVLHYFYYCTELREEDLDWLYELESQEDCVSTLVPVMSTIANNMRDLFQEKSLQLFIDFIDSPHHLVAAQAMLFSILLLAQYDMRVDFFPKLQNAFIEKIGDGEEAFGILCGIIRSSRSLELHRDELEDLDQEELPEDVRKIAREQLDEIKKTGQSSLTAEEAEYFKAIVSILPDTWVFEQLVGEDEHRMMIVEKAYLTVGYMDLMWDRVEEAEEWLVEKLRSGDANVFDYMNYGHCCFLRGDRILAYENYRQAKSLCKSNQEFLDLFRPDRKALIDKGIPLEDVYLMEDQLLRRTYE